MEKLDIVTGVQESDDYPYGRLRCHITFQVEFNAKKGFRFVTQTTNPKTNKVNKPKKSVYSNFMVMHNAENGHVKSHTLNIHGYDDIQKMIEFLTINDVEFSAEQSEFLWGITIACLQGNMRYTRIKEGTSSEFLEALRAKAMIKQYKAKADFNEIRNVGFDLEKVNSFRA